MHTAAQFIDPPAIQLLKLVVALLLGIAIGTERAVLARQAAGMRTFGLVALGAALFVVMANYVNSAYIGVLSVQPLYMPAAIITGIGFIGGGLIVMRGESLHGVTTAAGLWITAAIGMAIGFGMYAVGIFTTILALLVFTGMWYVESRFKHWFREHAGGVGDHQL